MLWSYQSPEYLYLLALGWAVDSMDNGSFFRHKPSDYSSLKFEMPVSYLIQEEYE